MTFLPQSEFEIRTDENYRLQMCNNQTGLSPLANLDLNMIMGFPVDPMHSVYISVVKKVLHVWINGNVKFPKHSQSVLLEVNKKISLLNSQIGNKIFA